MNEFKVGDIIRGRKNDKYRITNEEMLKAEVLRVENRNMDIKILDHKNKEEIGLTYPVENDKRLFYYYESSLEDIFSLPLGSKIITDKKEHNVFIKVGEDDWCNDVSDHLHERYLNEDLSIKDSFFGDKIIKVEGATHDTFYEQVKTKEMTVAEIEKALGYPVKIIKE